LSYSLVLIGIFIVIIGLRRRKDKNDYSDDNKTDSFVEESNKNINYSDYSFGNT